MISDLTRELLTLEELVVNFILPEAAKRQYRLGNVSKRELEPFVEQIASISGKYLGVSALQLNSSQVASYMLYYLPINFAKLAFLLGSELSFEGSKRLKVLDFGCGPGTGALATAASLDQEIEISLFDASSECTRTASRLLKSYRPKVACNIAPSLSALEKSTFDLVIAANVLSELGKEDRETQINQLIQLVDKNGYLLLLEPALKSGTQLLMHDRDKILAKNPEFSVTFPCFIQPSCPMLKGDSDDWCHATLPQHSWERPPLLKQLDQMLGFNKHRIKYSAFILQRAASKPNSHYRILRPIAKSHAALVCGERGLVKIEARDIRTAEVRRALKASHTFGVLDLDY